MSSNSGFSSLASWFTAAAIVLAVVAIGVILSRVVNTVASPIQLERVSSTTMCAKIISEQSVALSCWPEKGEYHAR